MNSENKIVASALATVRKVAVNSKLIVIHPSPTADTRSADHEVTREELAASTEQHIEDVGKGMDFVAKKIREAGKNHDWTKLRYFNAFYTQFSNAQKTGVWGSGWYDKIHIVQERHHLKELVPKNVTLIDVIEHIVDCVMAGKARAGEFKPDLLGAGILERAYMNTQKMISDAVGVETQKENT